MADRSLKNVSFASVTSKRSCGLKKLADRLAGVTTQEDSNELRRHGLKPNHILSPSHLRQLQWTLTEANPKNPLHKEALARVFHLKSGEKEGQQVYDALWALYKDNKEVIKSTKIKSAVDKVYKERNSSPGIIKMKEMQK